MGRVTITDEAPPVDQNSRGVGEEILDAAHDRPLRLFAFVPDAQRLERHLGVERADDAYGRAIGPDVRRVFDRQRRAALEQRLKVRTAHVRKADTPDDEAARVEPRERALD